MKHVYFYKTSIGEIGIAAIGNKISNVFINEESVMEKMVVQETTTIKDAYFQLIEYLNGSRKIFELEYIFNATEFRKTVWSKLLEIPYGKTISYKRLAENVGNPKASRAVGNANGKNPIPIFVPCHRVVKNDGKLGGYSLGLELKETLLHIEKEKM